MYNAFFKNNYIGRYDFSNFNRTHPRIVKCKVELTDDAAILICIPRYILFS
jgi:hypothetical protein